MTRKEAIDRLNAARIACGQLSDLDDLVAHPQNRIIRVQTESGEIELLAPGAVVRGEQRDYGLVPALDQHGGLIRQEFGEEKRTANLR